MASGIDLYRANDRHPVDPRMLIIQDEDEFKLWKEASKLRIHGLIWRYPETLETLEDLANGVFKASHNNPEGYGIHVSDWNHAQAKINNRLRARGVSLGAITIVTRLAGIYANVAHKKSNSINLLLNSQEGYGWHPDDTETVSLALTQEGTWCRSGNSKTSGDEYDIETGQVVLFDDTVYHRAPSRQESWKIKASG